MFEKLKSDFAFHIIKFGIIPVFIFKLDVFCQVV